MSPKEMWVGQNILSYFCSLSPLTVRRGQESNVGNDYGCYKQDARQLDHTMPVPSPSQAKGDTYECMVCSSGVMMGVVSTAGSAAAAGKPVLSEDVWTLDTGQ